MSDDTDHKRWMADFSPTHRLWCVLRISQTGMGGLGLSISVNCIGVNIAEIQLTSTYLQLLEVNQ